MFTFGILVIVVTAIYWFSRRTFNYWSSRNVPFQKPTLFIGNMSKVFRQQLSIGGLYHELYNKFSRYKYFGFYKCRQPCIIVRDLDVAKQVMIQNFTTFHDNEMQVSKDVDPLFGRNPFVLRGEEWKTVRGHLTPSFTPAKTKLIFPLIEANCRKVNEFMNANLDSFKCVDALDFARKFALDNIYTSVFGLETDSFTNPNSEEISMQRTMMNPSLLQSLKELSLLIMPSLGGLLKIHFFPKNLADYIKKLTKETVNYRESHNIIRQDYLHFMLEKRDKYQFDDMDLAAHCAGFFLDGVEATSTLTKYALYEIATNENVQTRLREEILTSLAEHDGSITFEHLGEMIYLDMVISECARKNPAIPFFTRICQKQTVLPCPDETSTGTVKVEVGTPVIVPIYAIHHDSAYYPDPEKFDPERFAPENVDNIPKGAYMPFGEGPRLCLGKRLGLLQAKMMICTVLRNFEVRVNPKTQVPLVMDPGTFLIAPIGGIWLDFNRIKTNCNE